MNRDIIWIQWENVDRSNVGTMRHQTNRRYYYFRWKAERTLGEEIWVTGEAITIVPPGCVVFKHHISYLYVWVRLSCYPFFWVKLYGPTGMEDEVARRERAFKAVRPNQRVPRNANYVVSLKREDGIGRWRPPERLSAGKTGQTDSLMCSTTPRLPWTYWWTDELVHRKPSQQKGAITTFRKNRNPYKKGKLIIVYCVAQ